MTTDTIAPPICPVHAKQMRPGKFGWFCATKVGTGPDGNSIFCDHKVQRSAPAKPAAATPAASSSASAAPAGNGDGGARLALALACLKMAGDVCGRSDNGDPVALAERAFDAMWARVE